jgi:hypothetical protein
MSSMPTSSSPLKIASEKYRILLLTSAAISVTAMGIALAASLAAVQAVSHADELPYRIAAGAFTKLTAAACALGLIGLCTLLVALRLIFRRIATAAQELTDSSR